MTWVYPVKNPYVTSKYGMRVHPISKKNTLHAGTDFRAPSGSPVMAVSDGVVTFAREWGAAGLHIRVQHEGGIETRYSHNSSFKKKPGDKVTAGETIALAGSTGSSTAPHLHFEVWISGVKTDPEPFLASKVKQTSEKEWDEMATKEEIRAVVREEVNRAIQAIEKVPSELLESRVGTNPAKKTPETLRGAADISKNYSYLTYVRVNAVLAALKELPGIDVDRLDKIIDELAETVATPIKVEVSAK